MAGQARASYPEKKQKNDQNPPAKNPSYHVKVALVCGGGPLYIATFLEKKRDIGIGAISPNQHTNTHADTPTRRHADRGHAAHTQPTHTPGGGWKVETTANTGRGLHSFFLRVFRVISTPGNPAAAHSSHTTGGAVPAFLYGSTPSAVTSYRGFTPPFPALYFSLSLRL